MKKAADRYNRVSLSLRDKADDTSLTGDVSNEELLERQKDEKDIIPELLERIYNNARYAMLSSAGYTAPRLNAAGVGSGTFLGAMPTLWMPMSISGVRYEQWQYV